MSEEIIRYEEVSPTAKLWRYMDLAKFISLIGKKKVLILMEIQFIVNLLVLWQVQLILMKMRKF